LEGRIGFGDFSRCPSDFDIVIDTRCLDDEDDPRLDEDEVRVEYFAMMHRCEPEYLLRWHDFINPLIKECKNGKSIYVMDYDGTAQAPMVAVIIYSKVLNYNENDALDDLNEAYLKCPSLDGRWRNIRVPRFYRMEHWAKWQMMGNDYDSYVTYASRKISTNRRARKDRRMLGDVKCSEVQIPEFTGELKEPRRFGYESVRISYNGGVQGSSKLHPSDIKNVKYNIMDRDGHTHVQVATNLQNLWISLFVFEDIHLDGFGKITDKFFEDQIMISHSLLERNHHSNRNLDRSDYIWWFGELIPYNFAYVYIFSNIYAALVTSKKEYKLLEEKIREGTSLLLIDRGTPDFHELGYTYEEFMEREELEWGPALVIYGLLKKQTRWSLLDIAPLFFAAPSDRIRVPKSCRNELSEPDVENESKSLVE
jgi:hypothetical protein